MASPSSPSPPQAKSKRQKQQQQRQSFPIPSTLRDLEREPYNLLPYPHDFCDDDEGVRAESFEGLVRLLEQTNQTLTDSLDKEEEDGNGDGGEGSSEGSSGSSADDSGEGGPFMDLNRLQAMYTLVR